MIVVVIYLLITSSIDPSTYRYIDHSPGGFSSYTERVEFIRIATKHGLFWRGKATDVWVIWHEKDGSRWFTDRKGRKIRFE